MYVTAATINGKIGLRRCIIEVNNHSRCGYYKEIDGQMPKKQY